ncbi:MAG: hypothetical protein AVDCRST_MAG89-4529, partial [uncultured Gemmatimonadetes bacterium]
VPTHRPARRRADPGGTRRAAAHARLFAAVRRARARRRGRRRAHPHAPAGPCPRARAQRRAARGGHPGAGPLARLRDPADARDGASDGGARVPRLAAARHRRPRLARGSRPRRTRAGRARRTGRQHVGDAAVPHGERLQRRRRRVRRGRLRQLRADRRLRAARLAGRQRARQDRHRALRQELPRHQGARGRAERGRGADHLQRSARRRLRGGRRVSRRTHAPRPGGAAGQRDERQRRPLHAGMAQRRRRAPPCRGADVRPAHSRGSHGVRRRGRAAARHPWHRRSAGVAGRAPLPLPRGPRPRRRAPSRGDGRGNGGVQGDLEHLRDHPRIGISGRDRDDRRAPRCVGPGRGRQRQRHGERAGGGARPHRAGPQRQPPAPDADVRHVGRRGVGADRQYRVRGAGQRPADARRGGVPEPGRVGAGAGLRRRRLALAAGHAARRGPRGAGPVRKGERVRGLAALRCRRRFGGAVDGRPGGRIGLRGLLQPPGHSARGLGLRRPVRRVPLAVRLVRVDAALRRPRVEEPRGRRAGGRGDDAAPGQRRRAAVRLRRVRADHARLPAHDGCRHPQAGVGAVDGPPARVHRTDARRRHGVRRRARRRARRAGAGTRHAAAHQRGAHARGACAHPSGGASHPALVPRADLRRGREQRILERGVPVRVRGRARERPRAHPTRGGRPRVAVRCSDGCARGSSARAHEL